MQDQKFGFIIFCNLYESTLASSLNSFEISLDEKVDIVVSSDASGSGIVSLESETSNNNLPLKETKLIKLISKGYTTQEEALEIGQNVLATLKLLGIKQKIGIIADTNNRASDKSFINLHFFDQIPEDLKKKFDIEIFNINGNNPGLSVFPLDKELLIIKSGRASFNISRNTKAFIKNMIELYPLSKARLNDNEMLAIDLYLSAQHESTIEAKFLFLIYTIECLSKEIEQPKEIIEYINFVLDDISKKFPEDKSLYGRIKHLKKKSIRQGCKDLITTFLEKDDFKLFDTCYEVRSQLVHSGKIKSNVNLSVLLGRLNEMVSQLLLKIIKSKGDKWQK